MQKKIFGFALAGTMILYFGYRWLRNNPTNLEGSTNQNNNHQIQKENKTEQKIEVAQLRNLKQQMDKKRPTQGQMKELYRIIVNQSKKNVESYIKQFKSKRRLLMDEDFGKYITYIRDGLKQLRDIDSESKQSILRQLGMSFQQYNNAVMRWSDAFQETESQILQESSQYLSVDQLRQGIQHQKIFLQSKGEQLLQNIKKQTRTWKSEQKQLIYQIINVVFSDQISKKFGYEQQEFERSSIKHKQELVYEITQLRDILTSLFLKVDDQEQKQPLDTSSEIKLNASLIKSLSGEPQFEKVMDAMHTA